MKRQPPGKSHERKHLIGGLLPVSESIIIMVGCVTVGRHRAGEVSEIHILTCKQRSGSAMDY